jgi:hypothetical protein
LRNLPGPRIPAAEILCPRPHIYKTGKLDLFRVTDDGLIGEVTLSQVAGSNGRVAAFSPDSRILLYAAARQIYAIDLQTGYLINAVTLPETFPFMEAIFEAMINRIENLALLAIVVGTQQLLGNTISITGTLDNANDIFSETFFLLKLVLLCYKQNKLV